MTNGRIAIALVCCVCALSAQAMVAPHLSVVPVPSTSLNIHAGIVHAGGMSLDQAVAMVQAKYDANVMRANTVEENGHTVHYIRLMTKDRSRVWTVRVDATTGREF